jgi:acyl dehydratase
MSGPGEELPAGLTLEVVVDDVVGDLEQVSRREDQRATVFERDDHTFAVLAGDSLDVRLDPAVAAAALRTPDTDTSPRGHGWVTFSPSLLDQMAVDRAAAWLEYAWRHALD